MSIPPDSKADLEWFNFENKLHEYVTQRLAPVISMVKQNEEYSLYQDTQISELRDKNSKLKKHIYQIEKKQRLFDDLKEELFSFKQQVRSHNILNREEHAKVRTDIENFKQNIKSFSETTEDVDGMVKIVKTELDKLQETIMDHKAFYTKELANAKTYVTDTSTDMQSEFEKLKLKYNFDSALIEVKKKEINQMSIDVSILKQTMKEDQESLIDLVNFKNVFEKSLNKSGPDAIERLFQMSSEAMKNNSSHDIQILSNHINQVEQELKRTDNFIEKQLPLQYTTAFGELLDYTIPSKNVREKLMEYMDYKITEYNEAIDKDTGWPTASKELVKAKVTGFKYSELTIPELVKQLKLKSNRAKKSPKTSPKLKNKTKFIPRIGLDRFINRSPQSNWDSQDRGSENNDQLCLQSTDRINVDIKGAKSDMQPGDFGDDYNYAPVQDIQVKDEEKQLDKVLKSVSESYKQSDSKHGHKESTQSKNEGEGIPKISQSANSKDTKFIKNQHSKEAEIKTLHKEASQVDQICQEDESPNRILRNKTLPSMPTNAVKKVTFDETKPMSRQGNLTISTLVKDHSLKMKRKKILKENTITEFDQNHLMPNRKLKIRRKSSDKSARIEEEEKIDDNESFGSRKSSPTAVQQRIKNPFIFEDISSTSEEASNKSSSNQTPSSSYRSGNLKLIQCDKDSTKVNAKPKVPLIKVVPMKTKKKLQNEPKKTVFQRGKSVGSPESPNYDENFKRDETPPQSQNTLRSDHKTLEAEFEVIKESAEQKEDTNTEKEESESHSFKNSDQDSLEESESEISEEEAASIIEHSTISRATMKRLTLVRKPTLEDFGLQSPTKLKTMTDTNNKNLKQEFFADNQKRDEEIKQQYQEYVSLKTNELSVDIQGLSKKLADYQQIAQGLRDQVTEDFLAHLKEETKRRIRDRNDCELKFDKIAKQIYKINENELITKSNITSVVDLLKSLITLFQINDMLDIDIAEIDTGKNCKHLNSVVISPFKRICAGHDGEKLTINGQQADKKTLETRKEQILDDIDLIFNQQLKSLCSKENHINLTDIKVNTDMQRTYCDDSKFIAIPNAMDIQGSEKERNAFRIRNSKSIGSTTTYQQICKKQSSANTTISNFYPKKKPLKMGKANFKNESIDYADTNPPRFKLNPRRSSRVHMAHTLSRLGNRSASSQNTFRTISNVRENN
ncbi:unnamed protein product [Moneuplotes crassus]|uniref:Uncharacterized protein n=1 Tax=Euplotes crassus TaxID=5936 RepID=A0AAD1XD12_EUPCR|nr:unnamed protein product [Moneuplotes crassus]